MLGDSITGLTNATLTIRRTTGGATYVDGIKQTPPTITITGVDVQIQPAFGLNRVIGGTDMHGEVDGQHATDVEVFNTLTEVFPLRPNGIGGSLDPDVIVGYKSADWTVARVEQWPDLDGGNYWRVVITKMTEAAS